MSPPRLSHYRQSRTGAGHERQVAAQQKVAGQQVSEVPTEPRRGQVIDLMAAFKASREKRRVAAPIADEAKEKPAARGGAGRGPTPTRARHARRCNGGARATRSKALLPHGHRIGGASYGAAIRLAQSPPRVRHGRAWGDATQLYSPRLSR
jgi:hypothetical protein